MSDLHALKFTLNQYLVLVMVTKVLVIIHESKICVQL